MKNQCHNLIEEQRNKLHKLLHKSEEFFDGTLGTRKTDPVDFELKYNTEPICSRPYPVTKSYKEML